MMSRAVAGVAHGAWLGGFPPYGYDLRCESADGGFRHTVRYERDGSKLLLDEGGRILAQVARRALHVVLKSDVSRLIPGEASRVETVRQIYRWFIEKGLSAHAIAAHLNDASVATARGPEWSVRCRGRWRSLTIGNMLRNPAYAGDLAWNRRTLARFFRISSGEAVERADADVQRVKPNPQEDWIVQRSCHEPLVAQAAWEEAQVRLRTMRGSR